MQIDGDAGATSVMEDRLSWTVVLPAACGECVATLSMDVMVDVSSKPFAADGDVRIDRSPF